MKLPYDTRDVAGEPTPAQPITLRGVANGAGALTLRTGVVPQGRRWLINYVTVTASGAATPSLDLYVDEALLANVLDGTSDASSAVAPYNPPRLLTQGETLVAVWVGATPGASCALRIEYDVDVI